MDRSVESTIEQIKLQEQDKEAKLKEKREYEASLASLNRAIKEATLQAEKSDQEQLELTKRIQKLQPLLEIEKIRSVALKAQLDKTKTMLQDLKAQSDCGITKVWRLRSSLCETVQNVSDEYDVWAFLMKPVCTVSLPEVVAKNFDNDRNDAKYDVRLQTAIERRNKAAAERDMLLAEPDIGEEYVRIKNALRYSLEKISNLQK